MNTSKCKTCTHKPMVSKPVLRLRVVNSHVHVFDPSSVMSARCFVSDKQVTTLDIRYNTKSNA